MDFEDPITPEMVASTARNEIENYEVYDRRRNLIFEEYRDEDLWERLSWWVYYQKRESHDEHTKESFTGDGKEDIVETPEEVRKDHKSSYRGREVAYDSLLDVIIIETGKDPLSLANSFAEKYDKEKFDIEYFY